MYVEYELHCSCGAAKTENSRRDIIEWLLMHWTEIEPAFSCKPKILWRMNNDVRELRQDEIDEFVDYIASGKAEKHDKEYPFGMPGLGQGPGRPFSRYGIPR